MTTLRILGLTLAFTTSALAAPAFAICGQPAQARALVQQANGQINAYRRAAGLPPLSLNGALSKAAQAHACDMVTMGRHSHVGSNGSDLRHRLRSIGYQFRTANENVGKFGKSNAADWWYNSAGHRANLLSPSIKEVGLGLALGPDQRHYWVMVGGAR